MPQWLPVHAGRINENKAKHGPGRRREPEGERIAMSRALGRRREPDRIENIIIKGFITEKRGGAREISQRGGARRITEGSNTCRRQSAGVRAESYPKRKNRKKRLTRFGIILERQAESGSAKRWRPQKREKSTYRNEGTEGNPRGPPRPA